MRWSRSCFSRTREHASVRGERLELGEGQAQQGTRRRTRRHWRRERALEGGVGVVLGLDDEAGVEVVPLAILNPVRARHLCGALGGRHRRVGVGGGGDDDDARAKCGRASAGEARGGGTSRAEESGRGGDREARRGGGGGPHDGWRAPGCRRARSSSSRGACAATEVDRSHARAETRVLARESLSWELSRGSDKRCGRDKK